MTHKKVIVALDSNNFIKTINLVKVLKNDAYAFKIGYQFFFNYGLIITLICFILKMKPIMMHES